MWFKFNQYWLRQLFTTKLYGYRLEKNKMSSGTLLGMWLPIHDGIKVNPW